MRPQRINYLNECCDARNQFIIDRSIRFTLDKYQDKDWIFTIEYVGLGGEAQVGVAGSTNAEIKAYIWDEETGSMTLHATGTASENMLSVV